MCALLLNCVACVPGLTSPARDAGDFREKAATTAGAAASTVATAALLTGSADADDAFGPYLSVSIGDAERDLDAVSSTFAAILPPDAESTAIRGRLMSLLDDSADQVSAARIAIRHGDAGPLPALQRRLTRSADALDAFERKVS